jgi:hypothetical protein
MTSSPAAACSTARAAPGDLPDLRAGVEPGEHQLGQLVAGDPADRLVQVDEALVDELNGDAEGGPGGALADPGLQHPQLAALDGELDVAQVPVVVLQGPHDVHQLGVALAVESLEVLQRDRVADARHDVLALGVLQVVAVHALLAAARVAGERHAGARVHAQVAEHHRDHVDRGAQLGRDALLAPVQNGPVRVPGVEHRADGQVQLLTRVLREVTAAVLGHDALEGVDQLAQVARVQVQVVLGALGRLGGVDRVLEQLALEAEHGFAEHLDQPAVGIPGEPLAAGLLGQAVHGLIGQADVQHGLHHPRHRELGPGPDADQQRVGPVAELAAHRRFQAGQMGGDLVVQAGRHVTLGQVMAAGVGADDEPGGNG